MERPEFRRWNEEQFRTPTSKSRYPLRLTKQRQARSATPPKRQYIPEERRRTIGGEQEVEERVGRILYESDDSGKEEEQEEGEKEKPSQQTNGEEEEEQEERVMTSQERKERLRKAREFLEEIAEKTGESIKVVLHALYVTNGQLQDALDYLTTDGKF